jgi:hypothetical protein
MGWTPADKVSNGVGQLLVPQRLSGPEMLPDETFQFFFGDCGTWSNNPTDSAEKSTRLAGCGVFATHRQQLGFRKVSGLPARS